MHAHRLHVRDWTAGLAVGATLGCLILGIGSRAGMRFVALESGQTPSFSFEGSVAVSLLGGATGVVIAALFLLLRTGLPTRRWMRALIFWTVCIGLALRGLSPLSILNVGVFLPLFVLHGALLHAFWCRVHLRRVRAP